MPTLTMELDRLPAAVRKLPEEQGKAIKRAIRQTLSVDAQRWIQWAIRGGGWSGSAGAPSSPRRSPQRARKAKGKVSRTRAKVSKAVRVKGVKRRKRKKAADPCRRKTPPAYRTPVDTGEYAASWRTTINPDGSGVFYSTTNPIKAAVIEEGRRRAWIPIDPLAQWVRRKLGCRSPKRARAIAFMISRAASRRRRAGLYVLKRAQPKIAEAFARHIERELKVGITQVMAMRSFRRR